MPVSYDDLTNRSADWSLDELVDEVNRLLPEVVPSEAYGPKLAVNARLLRHYTTEGALPRPLKDGPHARYDSDHLVRALALRRLLVEGYASGVAADFLRRTDRETLARYLLGAFEVGLQLSASPTAAPPVPEPHRERLAALRRRAGLPPLGHDDPGAAASAPQGARFALRSSLPPEPSEPAYGTPHDDAAPEPSSGPPPATPHRTADRDDVSYRRFTLLDGIELHLRDDLEAPSTPAAWNALRDAIMGQLERVALIWSTRRRT